MVERQEMQLDQIGNKAIRLHKELMMLPPDHPEFQEKLEEMKELRLKLEKLKKATLGHYNRMAYLTWISLILFVFLLAGLFSMVEYYYGKEGLSQMCSGVAICILIVLAIRDYLKEKFNNKIKQ